MKELKEFAKLSVWSPESGDQRKLYELALSGYEREEAKSVFNISENHFNVIYKKLKDRMAQGILENNFKDYTRVNRLRFGVRKQYEAAIMLLQTENKSAGIPLARAALRKAEKYGLYQVALDLSRELRRYYGTMNINAKLYQYYTNHQNLCYQELQHELKVEDVFFDFIFHYKKGVLKDSLQEKLAELEKLPSKSYYFHYLRYVCEAILCQIKRNDDAMLAVCREALSLFEEAEDIPYQFRYSFYYRAIAVYLARKEFHFAEIMINRSLSGPAYGQHNWQLIMFYRALLGFHSNKPAMAFDVWQKVDKVPKKFRTPEMEDIWLLVQAYFELTKKGARKWRLGKFLNSLQVLNTDKSGHNVSVLVVELMHLLKSKKFEKYAYRCERLDAYIDQHLKGKGLDRYVHFLRLLQCIVRGGFQKVQVLKKAKKYLHGLKETAPRIGADVREVEIVPFEALWEMALGAL